MTGQPDSLKIIFGYAFTSFENAPHLGHLVFEQEVDGLFKMLFPFCLGIQKIDVVITFRLVRNCLIDGFTNLKKRIPGLNIAYRIGPGDRVDRFIY